MMTRRAFSLIELLVTLGVIALLVSLLLPGLARARTAAKETKCLSHLRQLGTAWAQYSGDYRDRAMPLAYWSSEDIGSGEQIFWWGTHGTSSTPPDHQRGFIAPYLGAALSSRSVFECPEQPWGSYRPQGPYQSDGAFGRGWPTSTYGYNGYYLSPEKTPGWANSIGNRSWRRLSEIARPSELFVFADTLLAGAPARNCALLDPPLLFESGGWVQNQMPTTAFRHGATRSRHGATIAARADISVRLYRAQPEWVVQPISHVGSVDDNPAPHYVPDWEEWR